MLGVTPKDKLTPMLKFECCFEIHKELIHCNPDHKSFYLDKGIDVNAFEKLMIKNDMDQYTYILLAYFSEYIFRIIDADNVKIQNIKEKEKKERENYDFELTKSLQFLLSTNNGKQTSISFQKTINSFSTSEPLIVNSIINHLIHEYNNNGFNKFYVDFIDDFELSIPDNLYSKNERVEIDGCIKTRYEQYIYEFLNPITNYETLSAETLNYYMDFLKFKLDVFMRKRSKRGAKIKNNLLFMLCENFSYLVRIESYLNQSIFHYVDEIKLTNKQCRLIHDCLVFFKILEDKSNTLTKKLPENYIRNLLKQKKQDDFDIDYNKIRNFNIAELRNIKI